MRTSFQRPRMGALAAAVAALATTPTQSATVDWIGGSSFWDLVTNWSSNPLLPGAADDVVIDVAGAQTVTHRSGTNTVASLSILDDDRLAVSGGALTVAGSFASIAGTTLSGGTLTLNGASAMGSFAQSGGVLAGSGALAIAGASSWLAGTQTGTGTTRYDSALALGGAGAKAISGGRTVELNGTTTWGGNTAANNNALQFASGTLANKGTFIDQNAFASFIDHVNGTNAFDNIGTYNKTAGTVTTVEALFNNAGTVNVHAGTMLMQGASSTGPSGTWNLAAGAKLEFRNGSHTLDNATIQGAGTFMVSTENVGADAIVTLKGGTITAPFLFSGSTIAGTDRTFQGPATWTAGAFSGTAATTFANDLTISGPTTKVIVGGGTVNLMGTTTWSGNTGNNNNAIQFWNGATVNNHGTFNDGNGFASFIEHSVGGPHHFNNIGTYNKLSNTITTVDLGVAFNNSGVVNVDAGSFRPSGGTSTGTFNIAAGAVLDFKNGDNTLQGATTQGPGTLAISSDLVGADAFVTINGGTHTTPFAFSGSILSGDAHTFSGPVTWTGGQISGVGTTTFANDVTISGVNTKVVTRGRVLNLDGTTSWSGNTGANNNAIQFWNGATINNRGVFNDGNAFASFIEHSVGGPHNFVNQGTYNKLASTVTTVDLGVGFTNLGTLNLNAGTMRFVSGTQGPTGTLNVAGGATYQHDTASTAGFLNTAGTLNLGASTLTVFGDYNNANFGAGDAFDRRANVVTTGTGNRIVAGGDANQGITGAGVLNGNTAAPTLTIGNVHVGSTTYTYAIANTGSTGPALRGAVQTGVNGGSITDPRLSGTGVSAGNWGPLAPGASLARDVVVTVGAAGSLAPLAGQSVAIVNNFDNTRSQVVTFALAPGAAAYRLAEANTLGAVSFGNVHVGDVASQALTISNLAVNDGFSEKLNASFGSADDPRITFAGSVGLLGAGQSDFGSMTVGLNTAAAGSVNGAVVVHFASDGTGTSGLGITALPSQSVGVSGTIQAVGNVFRLASPSPAAPNPVDFGNVRVGSTASQALTIANTAPNDGFSEKLNASIASASPGVTAAGSFSLLAAQASNGTALVVGIDTATAGARSGSATITLASDGTGSSGLGLTALPSQAVAVSGAVYRLANPELLPASLSLAARVGDAAPTAALTVTNASPDIYTERLDAGLGAVGAGFTGSGSIAGLAAGASSTALGIALNTATAGSFAGTAGRELHLQRHRHDRRAGRRARGPERRPHGSCLHPGRGAGEHHRGRLRHRPSRRRRRRPRHPGDERRRGHRPQRQPARLDRRRERRLHRRRNADRARRRRDRHEQLARRPGHRRGRRLQRRGDRDLRQPRRRARRPRARPDNDRADRAGQQLRRGLARQERRRHAHPGRQHLHARLRHAAARRRRAQCEPERVQQRHRPGRPAERLVRSRRRRRWIRAQRVRLVRGPDRRRVVRRSQRGLRRRRRGRLPGDPGAARGRQQRQRLLRQRRRHDAGAARRRHRRRRRPGARDLCADARRAAHGRPHGARAAAVARGGGRPVNGARRVLPGFAPGRQVRRRPAPWVYFALSALLTSREVMSTIWIMRL